MSDRETSPYQRIAELERENAALKATLAAVFEANERGRKAWQEAHPNKEMVWPDQAKLVEWFLSENAELRAHAERLGDANDQMVVENAALREDKERLADAAEEVLNTYILTVRVETGHPCPENLVICRELRAAIDAARKETQP